jgi:prevent-host-death family protein
MQVNMLEAKSRLSQLVQAALDGEEVILARNGEPVARITRYARVTGRRKPGAFKGAIRMGREWDSPATNEMVDALLSAHAVSPPDPAAPAIRQPRARYRIAKRAQ